MEHHERGYPTVKTACQSAVWLQICELLKKRTRFDALVAILGPLCNIPIFRAQSSYRVVCDFTYIKLAFNCFNMLFSRFKMDFSCFNLVFNLIKLRLKRCISSWLF